MSANDIGANDVEIEFTEGVPQALREHVMKNDGYIKRYVRGNGGWKIRLIPEASDICKVEIIGDNLSEKIRKFVCAVRDGAWRICLDKGALPA